MAAMGRSPCCEEGLKKGPWTPEEDQKLLAYIDRNGHGSWRALPGRAGNSPSSSELAVADEEGDPFTFSVVDRAAEMREELPASLDELPAAGHQEGQVQLAGGADNNPTPRSTRQQVLPVILLLLLPLLLLLLLLAPTPTPRHHHLLLNRRSFHGFSSPILIKSAPHGSSSQSTPRFILSISILSA